MRLRNLVAGSAFGLAVLVLAQGGAVAVGSGHGLARNGDNHAARFQFEVTKRRVNDRPVVRGSALFEVATVAAGDGSVRVAMREAAEANFTEHRVEFAGPGSMRLVRNGRVIERAGRVRVFGIDNKPAGPNQNLPPDRVGVQFVSPSPSANEPPLTFGFEGNVVDGDVRIGILNPGSSGGGGGTSSGGGH